MTQIDTNNKEVLSKNQQKIHQFSRKNNNLERMQQKNNMNESLQIFQVEKELSEIQIFLQCYRQKNQQISNNQNDCQQQEEIIQAFIRSFSIQKILFTLYQSLNIQKLTSQTVELIKNYKKQIFQIVLQFSNEQFQVYLIFVKIILKFMRRMDRFQRKKWLDAYRNTLGQNMIKSTQNQKYDQYMKISVLVLQILLTNLQKNKKQFYNFCIQKHKDYRMIRFLIFLLPKIEQLKTPEHDKFRSNVSSMMIDILRCQMDFDQKYKNQQQRSNIRFKRTQQLIMQLISFQKCQQKDQDYKQNTVFNEESSQKSCLKYVINQQQSQISQKTASIHNNILKQNIQAEKSKQQVSFSTYAPKTDESLLKNNSFLNLSVSDQINQLLEHLQTKGGQQQLKMLQKLIDSYAILQSEQKSQQNIEKLLKFGLKHSQLIRKCIDCGLLWLQTQKFLKIIVKLSHQLNTQQKKYLKDGLQRKFSKHSFLLNNMPSI